MIIIHSTWAQEKIFTYNLACYLAFPAEHTETRGANATLTYSSSSKHHLYYQKRCFTKN